MVEDLKFHISLPASCHWFKVIITALSWEAEVPVRAIFIWSSPHSTLLSGGQASTATLLYNNQRKQVGAVGYWDNVAFDEVAKMKIEGCRYRANHERLYG